MLTVICVAYNHEPYIRDALEGFVNQQTDHRYKVIVGDDCSTDATTDIIKEYSKKYPNLITPVFRKQNVGPRYCTLDLAPYADTKYIAFCDGDDYWCNQNFIQKAIDILENNLDCTIVVGNTIYHNHKTGQKRLLLGDILPKPAKKFTFPEYIYTHSSARVYRNINRLPVFDIQIYYFMLNLGRCYYIDEVMSVYNITCKGIWSSLSPKEAALESSGIYYSLNKLFNYKYNDYYISNVYKPKKLKRYVRLLGKHLGWWYYIKKNHIQISSILFFNTGIKTTAADINKDKEE